MPVLQPLPGDFMLKKMLICAALLATPLFAKDAPLWTLTDPRGDDYGTGKLAYPMNPDFAKGDLDLTKLEAWRVGDGTQFVATFARPVRKPERRTVDTVGKQLDQVARYGFYNFNVDIYIDTDGVAGSGSTTTLPGRRVTIDPSTAWEKAINLTPDPQLARAELKRIVVRGEKRSQRAEGKKGIVTDEQQRELRQNVDEYVFFPTAIRVSGNRIEFYVPDSFLGGPAKKEWSYVVAVTGADVLERLDQQNRIMRLNDESEALMILPVTIGRPTDRFGGAVENDDFMPPIVDVIVPPGQDQKSVLSKYDADNEVPAVLTGVKP